MQSSVLLRVEVISIYPIQYLYSKGCTHLLCSLTVYRDTKTPSPFVEQFPNDDGCAARNARPDHIYMDCMGFGMGCSCLQVTFQACDIDEARHLYDQLAVVCPVMVRVCVCVCCNVSLVRYHISIHL